MKTDGSRKPRRNEYSKAEPRPSAARRRRGYGTFRFPDEQTVSTIHDVRSQMVKILPRLRRFALALTGGAEPSEDLIQETCVRALTHLEQWQPGTRLDSWMFRIAQNLWIDHRRAERSRGQVVDVEVIDDLLICDGRVIAENRIVLQEVGKDIAQLSQDQRNVISLVCGYGLSYKETGKMLNLPEGTVMSRLARARSALQKYM